MQNRLSFNYKTFFSLLIISLFSFHSVQSAAVFDTTFGTNGTVTFNIGNYYIPIADLTFQGDGKFIIALRDGGRLFRFNSNGTLDETFGNSGQVTVLNKTIRSIVVTNEGKIVVAGRGVSNVGSPPGFYLGRFNSNGTPDQTFGNNGVVIITQSSSDIFYSVKIQPDGKIVAAGFHTDGGDTGAIIRFNENGSLDSGFASGGVFYYPFQNTLDERKIGFQDVEILENGNILVSASTTTNISSPGGSSSGYLLLMLDQAGSISEDFGINGIVTDRIYGISGAGETQLEITKENRIFVAGYSGVRVLNDNGTLFKLLPFSGRKTSKMSDGRVLVSDFGSRNLGYIKLYSEESFIGKSSAVVMNGIAFAQPDGKILVVGSNLSGNLIIQRLNLITSQGTRSADFNSDDKADLAFYRDQYLYIKKSNGEILFNFRTEFNAKIIPEFYDVPQNTQFQGILFRKDLVLYYIRGISSISGGTYRINSEPNDLLISLTWGLAGDIPVGGDYNGDGLTDLTVFRPSDGVWYSINGDNGNFNFVQWGTDGDKPVPADYDYDGKTDYAVYRPSIGTWWILRSSDGSFNAVQFGLETDIPLTGDFDGDGYADLTVYRPSEGNWYQLLTTEGFRVIKWGIETDYPVPGDYDGDGRHDVAVYREGVWYILQSTDGMKIVNWGIPGDVPVSVRYDQ